MFNVGDNELRLNNWLAYDKTSVERFQSRLDMKKTAKTIKTVLKVLTCDKTVLIRVRAIR